MKKFLIPLIALLIAVVGTSCLGNDDNKATMNMTVKMYNRTVNSDGDITFSVTSNPTVVDLKNNTLSIAGSAKISDMQSVKYTLENVPLKTSYNGVYTFAVSNVKAIDGTTLSQVSGTLDLNAGMMYVVVAVDDQQSVYSTSMLGYPYGKFTIAKTGAASTQSYTYENSIVSFAIDETNPTKANMIVTNFSLASGDIKDHVSYTGINVTPTAFGYTLSADTLKDTNYGGEYEITKFQAEITGQGRAINASWKCKDYSVMYAGSMFKQN